MSFKYDAMYIFIAEKIFKYKFFSKHNLCDEAYFFGKHILWNDIICGET